jgi:hypothetical protein
METSRELMMTEHQNVTNLYQDMSREKNIQDAAE